MTINGPKDPRYKLTAKSEPDMFRYVAKVLAMDERAQGKNIKHLDGTIVTFEISTSLGLVHLQDRDTFGSDLCSIMDSIELMSD